ncbi:sensor histidine kinase [Streptomyces sp. R41]|uniref:histidine kinase n=1 Tax=Streptomyces sp. R41 TaxID=3238632 RepID=A0AB39RBU1_9ACTN
MARSLQRHPAVALAAKFVLAGVLILLVTYEGVALARQPTGPHVVVWGSGIVVCLCAVPWGRVPRDVRAWVAVGVSWAVTLYLLIVDRPLVVWGMGEAVALLVLLTGVLLHAPARRAAVLGPLLAVACMAAPVRDADPGRFTLLFAVLTVVVTAFSLLLRAQNAQRVRDLEAVRTAERLELARELHDLVAHYVTGMVVQARAAAFTGTQPAGESRGSRSGRESGPSRGDNGTQGAPGRHPTAADAERATDAFERIAAAGDEALGAMRRLVRVLREERAPTAPIAGLGEIRELADTFSRIGPPAVLYVEPGLPEDLPADLAAAAHRIVRESLTNIRKHAADATAVRIALRTVPTGLEVRVADDGTKPLPGLPGSGFGLVGLTERVTALGGSLTAGPAPEGGWQVRAVLPYEKTGGR